MTKKLVMLSIAISILILSSCAVEPMWHKVGVTPFDTNSALAKCRYDISLAKVDKSEKMESVKDCMNAQGFRYN